MAPPAGRRIVGTRPLEAASVPTDWVPHYTQAAFALGMIAEIRYLARNGLPVERKSDNRD